MWLSDYSASSNSIWHVEICKILSLDEYPNGAEYGNFFIHHCHNLPLFVQWREAYIDYRLTHAILLSAWPNTKTSNLFSCQNPNLTTTKPNLNQKLGLTRLLVFTHQPYPIFCFAKYIFTRNLLTINFFAKFLLDKYFFEQNFFDKKF